MKELRKYIKQVLQESLEGIDSVNVEEVFDLIEYHDSFKDLYPGYNTEFENEYAEDYYFPTKEKAYEEVTDLINFFKSLPNPIPIFRTIRVNSLDEIRLDYLGDSWSYEKQSALNFASNHNGGNVLLSAYIPKDSVDWKATLKNHFLFSDEMDDFNEDEIKVDDFDKIQDLKVEWIKNIVQESKSPKLKLNRYLYHSSNTSNRKRIKKNGIVPYRGVQWLGDTDIDGNAVFATNSENKQDWFDSTWDDDIWRIDTKKLKGIQWFLDPNTDNGVWVYTKQAIPREAIELVKVGTGEDLLESSEKNVFQLPEVPGTQNFWHGGNLDSYDDIIAQKNGRYEYGPGLYLTTQFDVAQKYTKGSRKMYLVTVADGVDISNAVLSEQAVQSFIKSYVLGSKRKEVWERLQKYRVEGGFKAYVFNNIILNGKAIKPSNTSNLRQFYVENGIDYDMVDNAFGWGEKMMVLFNMKKIVSTKILKPGEVPEKYNLH